MATAGTENGGRRGAPFSELVRSLFGDVALLARREAELAKVELEGKASKVGIAGVRSRRRMPSQRIEDDRSRRSEHRVSINNREQCTHAPAFSTFARDLERQLHRGFQDGGIAPRDPSA